MNLRSRQSSEQIVAKESAAEEEPDEIEEAVFDIRHEELDYAAAKNMSDTANPENEGTSEVPEQN